MTDPFADLPRGHYGAILADPPWDFKTWSGKPNAKGPQNHYSVMEMDGIAELPVSDLAAPDCVLFTWICWPILLAVPSIFEKWGFAYKTCAFSWMKAHAGQIEMFREDADASVGLGYWTRANSEVCLLATRGQPKRLNADVRQGIIAPRREHSRKPDCVHERIERLVAGPYLELFARQSNRPGWDYWGNQVERFNGNKNMEAQSPATVAV